GADRSYEDDLLNVDGGHVSQEPDDPSEHGDVARPLPHDHGVDELDGDVLGIRAPTAIAERDEPATRTEPARHVGGRGADRLGTLDQGQTGLRRRAKASATALEATAPDRAPSMPFTDAPPAHASEKTTSATPRGGDRVVRRAKQKECLMLARKRDPSSRAPTGSGPCTP